MAPLRTLVPAVALTGLLCVGLSPLPAAAATPSAPTTISDFDGDGLVDLAVADADLSTVRVRYGNGRSLDFTTRDLDGVDYELRGVGILVHDLNADGYADLVVAQEASYVDEQTPAVFFLFGSAAGLDPARNTRAFAPSGMEQFGSSLALLTAPSPLLVVGAPHDMDDGGTLGGLLVTYPLGPDGLPTAAPTVYSQDSPGVPGKAEPMDFFGASLAASGSTLLVGAPLEDVGTAKDAGAVAALTWRGGSFSGVQVTEATKGVPGTVAGRHYFGSSVAIGDGYAVVGVPGAGSGKARQSGRVQPFQVSKGRLVPLASISQATSGVPGVVEAGDVFGGNVAMVRPCAGVVGALVSATGERSGTATGAVWTVPLTKRSTCASRNYAVGKGLAAVGEGDSFVGAAIAPLRHADPSVVDGLLIASSGEFEGPSGHLHVLATPTSADEPADVAFGEPVLSQPQA